MHGAEHVCSGRAGGVYRRSVLPVGMRYALRGRVRQLNAPDTFGGGHDLGMLLAGGPRTRLLAGVGDDRCLGVCSAALSFTDAEISF